MLFQEQAAAIVSRLAELSRGGITIGFSLVESFRTGREIAHKDRVAGLSDTSYRVLGRGSTRLSTGLRRDLAR